jgi:2'-5' RNA ligase
MFEQDLFGDVPAPAPRVRQPRAPVTGPKHSWFFAVRPAPEDAARIDAFARSLLAAHGVTGKRLGPDRLHISLDAVGDDIAAAELDAACRAADAVQLSAFDLRFDSALTFSGPQGPLVLLGGKEEGGLGGVHRLRTVLGCAMADQGFKPSRSYEPHMTLCYDPHHRLPATRIEPIGFRAAEFALVKSHIGLSRHEVVRSWALAAGR